MSFLSRAWDVWRRQGPARLWFKLLHELDLYRHLVITQRRVGENLAPMDLRIEVEVERLGPEKIDEYLAFRTDQTREEIQQRFDRTHACFGCWHEGRLIAVCWSGPGPVYFPYIDCTAELPDDTAYTYDNFVAPEFRGKGVPSSFRHERRAWLRENGFVWSVGDVWPENAAAWKRGLRRGRNLVAVLSRVRLGPWSRVFVRPIRGADHPPRLRLLK